METVNVSSLSMTLQRKKDYMDFNTMTFLYKNNMNCHEKMSNWLTKHNHHLSKQSSPTDLLCKNDYATSDVLDTNQNVMHYLWFLINGAAYPLQWPR